MTTSNQVRRCSPRTPRVCLPLFTRQKGVKAYRQRSDRIYWGRWLPSRASKAQMPQTASKVFLPSDSRLNDLVSEKVTPRNRNEEEIAGYRDALSVIHESHDYIPITPNVILQLHRDLFRHTPLTFAGHFKDSDNVIIERDAHGTSTVRFAPPSALVTPELIERACSAYTQANPRWTYRSIACHRHVHSRFHLHTSVQ